MKLPARIVDISATLDNDTVLDPPFMRPKIEYHNHAETAPMLCEIFPGLRIEDLPEGEGWAIENVQLATHNGTHMDAPMHFQSHSIDGKAMMTIDQVPLDWFSGPASSSTSVKCPMATSSPRPRSRPSLRASATSSSRSTSCWSIPAPRAASARDEYLTAGIGMGREATLYLTSRGVRVAGIDAWGWDAPFAHMRERWLKTRDPSIIWEGHKAGREIPYCHMEKLCNLEQLPADGFTVACFPHKVKGGSGGWTRAVALFD